MIGETFSVNNKTYTIKRKLKFNEVTKIQENFNELLELQKNNEIFINAEKLKEFSEKPIEEQIKIIAPGAYRSHEQQLLVARFLKDVVGLTDAELDNLDYDEALLVFSEGYRISTSMKKKQGAPSG